jgi:hypothetical protein
MSKDVVKAALEAAEYWPTDMDEDRRRADYLFWFRLPHTDELFDTLSTFAEQHVEGVVPPLELRLNMANARLSATSSDTVLTGKMALSVYLLDVRTEAGSILLKTRSCSHGRAVIAAGQDERIKTAQATTGN